MKDSAKRVVQSESRTIKTNTTSDDWAAELSQEIDLTVGELSADRNVVNVEITPLYYKHWSRDVKRGAAEGTREPAVSIIAVCMVTVIWRS